MNFSSSENLPCIVAFRTPSRLHVQQHFFVEVTNALRRQHASRTLSETESRLAIDGLWMLPGQAWLLEGVANRVWDLGAKLSSYDAAYVALAEGIRAPLVTADARFARTPGPNCAIELFG